ncbi:hypothetical protein GCM10011316_25870 [Roseibium aquae]|uniref:Bacterial spore germination immunoglobulin-like domain-containing protein n=1 Tax=Roseibium aquae TaxID=1323746 RepID=A0A916TLH5_9HYPH|nr:hypothetical protein [Roseibium aquae]GGB52649.1 hypothetical protein GCM10011316_25870 [Roseibium aquae]
MGKQATRLACGAALGFIFFTAGAVASETTGTEPSVPAPSAALQQSQAMLDSAWRSSPLAFSKAVFTTRPASGYGQYDQRPNAEFGQSEAIHVYAEPVAYGFAERDGEAAYALTADYRLLTPSGQVLAEETGFARFAGTARQPRFELETVMSFQFEGLPAGSYILELTYQDEVDAASARITLPFRTTAGN